MDLAGGLVKREQLGKQDLILTALSLDADGGAWTYRQTFHVDSLGGIVAETTVSVNQDSAVPIHGQNLLVSAKIQTAFSFRFLLCSCTAMRPSPLRTRGFFSALSTLDLRLSTLVAALLRCVLSRPFELSNWIS